MACGCGQNSLQRVLYYPITELDKMEYELVKENGYSIATVPDWKSYQFLSAFTKFDAPSQTILAAVSLSGHDGADVQSLAFLAGLSYPLLVETLVGVKIPSATVLEALANNVSEEQFRDLLSSVL